MPYPPAAENDVIVRVYAAGFTPGELDWPGTWSDRAGRDRTLSVPGHELSGVVVELGYGTTGLTVGQRVFGLTDWTRDGSLAEYTAVEARNLAPSPPTSTTPWRQRYRSPGSPRRPPRSPAAGNPAQPAARPRRRRQACMDHPAHHRALQPADAARGDDQRVERARQRVPRRGLRRAHRPRVREHARRIAHRAHDLPGAGPHAAGLPRACRVHAVPGDRPR